MPKPNKSHELLDFEIAFYEQLAKEHPTFTDALVALGEAYTRRGLHDKGLEIDQRLVGLKAKDPVIWYNLACSYSLLTRLDDAMTALRRAIELGYDDFTYLKRDPDLRILRQSPQFQQFLQTLA